MASSTTFQVRLFFAFFFLMRAILKGLTFRLCLDVLCLYSVYIYIYIMLNTFYIMLLVLRFELVTPEGDF